MISLLRAIHNISSERHIFIFPTDRTLKLQGKNISQGSLRIWLEIMAYDVAQSRPLAVLASPDPEDFELRVNEHFGTSSYFVSVGDLESQKCPNGR